MKRILAVAAVALAVATPGSVLAHTEPDVVAVPAGAASVVNLKPTHGCGESPTIAVRIRAPFPDAAAGLVDGWTATATPDGEGNTVLEWTGNVLPADQEGAFPVEFTAPDTPGVLLTFPAIQVCENGEELAWISGDPADQYPAPRVLVLPAGSEPATSIDDVAPDAPGRDQLVAVVDVDNPNETTTTTAAPTTVAAATTTTVAATITVPAEPTATTAAPPEAPAPGTSAPVSSVPPTTAGDADDGDSGSAAGSIAIGAAAVAVLGGGAALVARRRST